MQSIFITGTDTDAGKTIAAAALLNLLLHEKIDAMPMKPVQTGCTFQKGKWVVPDIEFVIKASGLSITLQKKQLLCPYKFKPACSPHLAAKKAKVNISPKKIIQTFNYLSSIHEIIIAEGAGGIMVPVNGSTMMLDIMKLLNLPVVLSSRPGLGTINHTLLSLNEIRRAGLHVAGIIFCETKPPAKDFIEKDNYKTIERLGKVPVFGTIPYIKDIDSFIESPQRFNRICRKSLPNALTILREL